LTTLVNSKNNYQEEYNSI